MGGGCLSQYKIPLKYKFLLPKTKSESRMMGNYQVRFGGQSNWPYLMQYSISNLNIFIILLAIGWTEFSCPVGYIPTLQNFVYIFILIFPKLYWKNNLVDLPITQYNIWQIRSYSTSPILLLSATLIGPANFKLNPPPCIAHYCFVCCLKQTTKKIIIWGSTGGAGESLDLLTVMVLLF